MIVRAGNHSRGGLLIRDGKIDIVRPSDEIEKQRATRRLSISAGGLCFPFL